MVTTKQVKTDDTRLNAAAETFTRQLKERLNQLGISHETFADRLDVSQQRVTRILKHPGNLTLDVMLRTAAASQMKLALVLYEPPPDDPDPIPPELFRNTWQQADKPTSTNQLKP